MRHFVNVSVQPVILTDGSMVYNVKITTPAGDFIEIPAVNEVAADKMALEIADVITNRSTADAVVR